MYMELHPRYDELHSEYHKFCEIAKLNEDCFPFQKWKPSILMEGDLDFLKPIATTVGVHNYIEYKHCYTGRLNRYSSISEKDSKTLSSYCYVRVYQEESSEDALGRVELCLSHKFVDMTTKFVLISLFEDVQLDVESGLSWVSTMHLTAMNMKKVALPPKYLSPPLVVAISSSEERLWFLTT